MEPMAFDHIVRPEDLPSQCIQKKRGCASRVAPVSDKNITI